MKQIVLFGANCGKCKKTEAIINSVIEKYSINAAFLKVTDIQEMIKNNINYLPSVIIDNKIVFKGIVPSEKEVLKVLI
jgi:small redox-active disulfide protein 2